MKVKIYEQPMQFVIDDSGAPWVWSNGMIVSTHTHEVRVYACRNIELGIEILKQAGHIAPDPLEEALETLCKNEELMPKYSNMPYIKRGIAENIVRKLAADLRGE